jgi:hypothetical protein
MLRSGGSEIHDIIVLVVSRGTRMIPGTSKNLGNVDISKNAQCPQRMTQVGSIM